MSFILKVNSNLELLIGNILTYGLPSNKGEVASSSTK